MILFKDIFLSMKKNFVVLLSLLSLSVFAQNSKGRVSAFAPEVISQFPATRDFTMASNGNEAYITVLDHSGSISVLVELNKDNDRWNAIGIVPFSGPYKDLEPFLSPDGFRLYFASNRPLEGAEAKTDFDIWYVTRTDLDSPWSSPVNPGAPVNTDKNEFYPAVASNGNLYFTSDSLAETSKDDLFYAIWSGDTYSQPVRLPESVNTEGYEFNSYIAADESFLLFSGYNRKDGVGGGDLYISYNKEGNWTPATNLGMTVNSPRLDYCPFYDEKDSRLYFTSNRNSVEMQDSIESLISELNKHENGQSRIYLIDLDLKK
jgi:hypothetical protein